MEKKLKIVVVSRSYEATLGIGHSLFVAGYKNIDLIFFGDTFFIVDKSNVFVTKTHIPSCISQGEEADVIGRIKNLYKVHQNKIVLFPADDFSTSLLDRHRSEFPSNFLFSYIDGRINGAITCVMDKKNQTIVAHDFGMPVAKSWEVECINGVYQIPSDLIYPCFVKPLLSANGPAKSIIRKHDTYTDLRNALNRLVKNGRTFPLLIQEYIPIEEEFNVHGICDRDRVFLPLIHKKIVTGQFNKGVTIMGKNMKPEYLEPQISCLKTMLSSYGYHGIFNVEMFVSKGKVYLNEINFRIAGTCWGGTGCGVNIPELWVETLLGNLDTWPKIEIKYDSTFINDKTAFEDVVRGNSSLKEYLQWNKGAQYHLIKCNFDPKPWSTFLKFMIGDYVKRRLVRIKRKIFGAR